MLVVVIGLLAVVICGRLIHLQGFRHVQFTKKVASQSVMREDIQPRPGDIFDRHGRLLASSVNTRSLYVVPSRIENPWQVSQKLSEVLQIDPDRLFERISINQSKQFAWVKRRLTLAEVDLVKGLELPSAIFGFRNEYLRRYPQGELGAQVIGLRNIDGIGQGGIEQSLDSTLRGKVGWRELIQDARGHVIDMQPSAELPPEPGQDVMLTLDTVIQLYTEQAIDELVKQFQPVSCCAVVLSPRTGEVLAMTSRPTFDPNFPDKVAPDAWKNRVVTDMYEPGSTFKPMVVAWALQQGLIQRDETFNCENGAYQMGRRLLHDHHPYGQLSLTDVLVKSSNIGMAKIGERLTNEGLYSLASNFGFGRKTGIELPSEETGLLRPIREWTSYSTGSIPMGQELSTTPIQMIAAFSALANGGRLVAPHLILRIGQEGQPQRAILSSDLIRADIADWLTQNVLTEVVRRGTGRKAQLGTYTVFGKTGTAQKIDPLTGQYSRHHNISSFICGGPAESPEALVLVTVDQPTQGGDGFGGTVAAPTAAKILESTLRQLQIPSVPTLRSAMKESHLPVKPRTPRWNVPAPSETRSHRRD